MGGKSQSFQKEQIDDRFSKFPYIYPNFVHVGIYHTRESKPVLLERGETSDVYVQL